MGWPGYKKCIGTSERGGSISGLAFHNCLLVVLQYLFFRGVDMRDPGVIVLRLVLEIIGTAQIDHRLIDIDVTTVKVFTKSSCHCFYL